MNTLKLTRAGAVLSGFLLCAGALPAQLLAASPAYEILEMQTQDDPEASKPAVGVGRAAPPSPSLLGMGLVGEVEPNGTPATATALSGSQGVVQGKVFGNGDIDFFAISAQAGDRISAAVMTAFSASASTDSQLRVFAPDGTTLIEFDEDDGSAGGLSSTIAGATLPAAGTYYLQVNHFSATNQLRPYELHYRLQRGAPVAEVEPNDTSATATPLPASGWVSGARDVAIATEQDWYSFNLNAGDTVYLALDLDPERDNVQWDGRVGMGLFGDGGNQILVVSDSSTGSVANPLSEAFFLTVKEAGTYYAFVDSPSAAVGGPTATYHLSVTVHPAVDEGVNCTTYTSTNVPQTIGPGAGLVSSTITVPGNPRIADLDVSIQLNHGLMADIDAQLRSPSGNNNALFNDIGSTATGGQTQMDLTLDDEAGAPPAFTVVRGLIIKPELNYRLSWFDGEDAGGTWTLDLHDDLTNASGGTLTGWSMRICEAAPAPSCPIGSAPITVYSTDFETDAAGFTSSGTANEWERGLPATVATTTTNPIAGFSNCASGVNCFKTDLDNTYDASSNQDLLSPNIDLTGFSGPVIVRWAQRYQMESATFDRYNVDFRQVGGGAAARLFDWLGATMSVGVGNPTINIPQASGWSRMAVRADALAGLNTELLFHLDSDSSVNFAGVAIDDVSVTACRALVADLSITKTDGVTTAVPGGSVTYTVTASNAGPDAVTGATVADTFPAACTANWTCVGAGGGTCTAAGAGNINDNVNLPAGGSVTYTASCAISAAATGTLSNTATVSSSVTDPTPGNNSATDTDTLTPQADLAITKSDGVVTVVAGSSTVYSIVASNAGPSDAPGTTVADTAPAACTSFSWTCSGSAGGSCTASGSGSINDTITLPAGASVTYSATCAVSAAATGTLSNTATVTPAGAITDPTPGNNSATDSNSVLAPGALGVTPSAINFGTVAIGANSATQNVTLSNSGGSALTVNSISVAMAPFVRMGGSCGAEPFVIAAGGSCTIGYYFSPSAAGAASQTLTVNAGASGSASIALSGSGGAGSLGVLSASLSFGGVSPGSSAVQSLTIQNTGTGPLQVTAITAAAAPFAQIAGGSCTALPFSLAAGTSCTVQYRFSPTAAGSFSQLLTISSDVGTASATLAGSSAMVIAVDSLSEHSLLILLGAFALFGMVALRRRG